MSEKVEAQIGVIKEGLKSIVSQLEKIDKTYVQMPTQAKVELEFPDVDLHELEHDPEWRSFRKDAEGRCTYPAEEGKAAWLKIGNVANDNPILRLVKAMGRNKVEKVSVGSFEYRIRGDFLQRRPLKKPEEDDPHSRMEKNIQNVKKAGQRTTG